MKASDLAVMAAVEVIRRFDGPVNGMRFERNELSRTAQQQKVGCRPIIDLHIL